MPYPTPFRRLAFGACALLLLGSACHKDEPAASAPSSPTAPTSALRVAQWLTLPDKSALLARQPGSLRFGASPTADPTIVVDTTRTYQTMDGFGYCLTGGSAQVMSRMSAGSRAALIQELFGTDSTALGISYLRVSIGASDLNDRVYTYDDMPAGQTDPALTYFSLAPDQAYVIPVLKEILAVNPNLKILGSPWTAPSWMKSSGSSKGGHLIGQFYPAYAQYFVRYLQAMQAAGIRLDAITVQNEPLNADNNPSLVMEASEQAAFVKNNLGPAFRAAGLSTKIIVWDHNADNPGYPLAILGDAAASPYVDGSAFHLYGGTIEALTTVHNTYPAKNVYFTEQWTQSPGNFAADVPWHAANLEVAAPRNWARNVLEWNLAADPQQNPHTPGGCTECLGAITISGNDVARNPAYYSVGHASKFVRPGSVRVATNVPADLPNVAYQTPGGKHALLVVNTGLTLKKFNIEFKGQVVSTSLSGGAVATYIW